MPKPKMSRGSSNYHAHHRANRPTLGAVQRREPEREMGEKVREQDDLEIRLRRLSRPDSNLVRSARRKERVYEDVEQRNQYRVETNLERNCFAYQLFARHPVVFAELDRQHSRMPNADERSERRKEHHDGHRDLESRHGVHPAPPDERPVHYGVERVQGHRD
jgi:hypothetical protein